MLPLLLAVSLSVSPYGVNAHLPSSTDLDAVQAAGIAWVRYDFNWFQIEPNAGQLDWTAQDAAVDAAVARGIDVYVTLAYTPQWAAVNPGCVVDSPDAAIRCQTQPFANVDDWKAFVTAAVARYKDRVTVYGMWNEPNLGDFYQGSQTQYENDVLKPGAAAVHAECPACLVAGPELSGLTASSRWNGSHGICAFGGCIRNGWELDLGGVLDAAGSSLDVVTQHFYDSTVQNEAVGQLCDGEFFGSTMTHDSLRDVLATHGATGKPLWLTETGMESSGGEQAQADFLSGLLLAREELAGGSYVAAVNDPFTIDKIFLYDLKDGGSDAWGLLRADGSTKPSYDAVAQFIDAHPGTPSPTPTVTPTGTPTPTPTPSVTPTPGPGNGGDAGGGGCDVAPGAPTLLGSGLLLAALLLARRIRS
jgi:hypothetical protein